MRRLIFTFLAFGLAAPLGCSGSSTSGGSEGQTLVGKWEPIGSTTLPAGTVVEFTADGKIQMHVDADGKQISKTLGTYSVAGDKLTLSGDRGGKTDTETMTIKVLTADSIVLVEPSGKEVPGTIVAKTWLSTTYA
jgi:uncharacterized protein (TIGR03066 family)